MSKYAGFGWPAMMPRAMAAAYCGMSVANFMRAVMAGNLPEGRSEFCAAPLWSRSSIDAVIERPVSQAAQDWRSESKLWRDETRG